MSDPVFIFVYGSLRRGCGHVMSLWLAEHAVWQVAASVSGRLYRVSNYPALACDQHRMVAHAGRVRGDLYRLDHPEATLPVLDGYEGIQGRDDDEYERCLLTVTPDSGAALSAWVYCYRRPVHALAWIESGDWLSSLACHE